MYARVLHKKGSKTITILLPFLFRIYSAYSSVVAAVGTAA